MKSRIGSLAIELERPFVGGEGRELEGGTVQSEQLGLSPQLRQALDELPAELELLGVQDAGAQEREARHVQVCQTRPNPHCTTPKMQPSGRSLASLLPLCQPFAATQTGTDAGTSTDTDTDTDTATDTATVTCNRQRWPVVKLRCSRSTNFMQSAAALRVSTVVQRCI
eukprot:COSAG01_NODE_3505_length_5993_cov_5.816763_2_plen_168_part_00